MPLATPNFRKRHQKSYLCRVRLVRCEIFADSSLLGGLFICEDCYSRVHRRKGLCLRRVLWAILRRWGRFVVVPYWASFYLVLPLSLITRDMPATAFGAAVNVHRDARCEPALIGDHASFVFGKVKVLSLTVFTAA